MLYDLFKRKWFGSRRGTITQIDLQRKQWKLCPPDCKDCNCTSKAFKSAISRGIDRIADFLPTRKMHNPMWPGGPPPQAKAAAPTQVKEEAKDEGELPAGSQRGGKQIRVLEDPKHKVKVKLSAEDRDRDFHLGHKSDRIILCDPATIDKKGLAEARAEQLKRKEELRERLYKEERVKSRDDDLELDPRSTTASSSRVPSQGPKPPSGAPPKVIHPPPRKVIRKAIPAPPQVPSSSSKAAGATPASAATSDAEIIDSDAKTAEDICREHEQEDIINVLTKSLQVFMPEMGVWQAI